MRFFTLLARWAAPVLLSLLAFELFIGNLVWGGRRTRVDPVWGRVPVGTWVDGTEGFGRIQYNALGLPGGAPPEGDVLRVVVIGDSFTQGAQVLEGQRFCDLVEQRLSAQLGRRVWVANCSAAGWEPGDYASYLRTFTERFHPSAVVIVFSPADLWLTNDGALSGMSPFRFDSPEVLPGPKSLSGPDTFSGLLKRLRPLYEISALVNYGYRRIKLLRASAPEAGNIEHVRHLPTVDQVAFYLGTVGSQAAAPLLCVALAPASPVNHQEAGVVESLLRKGAAASNTAFAGTHQAFESLYTRTHQPGVGFSFSQLGPGHGHLNAAGHRIMADAIVAGLLPLLGGRH